jgi:transcriptional activator SPT7
MILHVLHETGQVRTADLEAHLKDDVEREEQRYIEMSRKMRQAFQETVQHLNTADIQATGPAIEDEMMFAEGGGYE